MTLETFAEEMKIRIQKKMGNDYEVTIDWFREMNGRKNGKLTIEEIGTNLSPAVKLDRHFEMVDEETLEMDLEKAAEEIIRECSKPIPMKQLITETREHITDYELCKDKLLFKLVNTSLNQELLEDYSYLPFLDLSILFYLMVGEENGMNATILVTENLRKAWGVSVEELYQQALKNGPEKMPAVFTEMNRLIISMMIATEESPVEVIVSLAKVEKMKKNTLYCLTNRLNKHGAAVILYPGMLKECAEKCGMDMIIFPCSVHEMLLMPFDDGDDLDYLTQTVREVNQIAVEEDEVLSDHIYRYDYQTDQLLIA